MPFNEPSPAAGSGLTLSGTTFAVNFAAQADMETPSSGVLSVPPSVLHHHPGVVKAYAVVTQSAGTYTLQTGSYNVSGINKTGTGVVQVNLSVTFSATSRMCPKANVTDSVVRGANASATSTSQVTVSIVRYSTEVATDSNFTVIVLGDL